MRRKNSNRLKGFDYSSSAAYFVTIRVEDIEQAFGKISKEEMKPNSYGNIAKITWFELNKQFENILLDEFVTMPNHIHGIIMIINDIIPSAGLMNQQKIIG